MKFNFTTILRDLEGAPLTKPLIKASNIVTAPVLDDKGAAIMISDNGQFKSLHANVLVNFTAKDCAIGLLTADAIAGVPVAGDVKFKRVPLALKIIDNTTSVELESEDVTLLKTLVKDLNYPLATIHAFCQFLEGKPQRGEIAVEASMEAV